MAKEVLISIADYKYSFSKIVLRTEHAPIDEVAVSRLIRAKPTGKKEVDSSEVRVCKINGITYLLTGYDKVVEFIELYLKEPNPQLAVTAKIMSPSYLLGTVALPSVASKESIAKKLNKTNFKVTK
jgi:hypothetical protein